MGKCYGAYFAGNDSACAVGDVCDFDIVSTGKFREYNGNSCCIAAA